MIPEKVRQVFNNEFQNDEIVRPDEARRLVWALHRAGIGYRFVYEAIREHQQNFSEWLNHPGKRIRTGNRVIEWANILRQQILAEENDGNNTDDESEGDDEEDESDNTGDESQGADGGEDGNDTGDESQGADGGEDGNDTGDESQGADGGEDGNDMGDEEGMPVGSGGEGGADEEDECSMDELEDWEDYRSDSDGGVNPNDIDTKYVIKRVPPQNADGYVYIFTDGHQTNGEDRFKVGSSKYPSRRLKQFRTGNLDIRHVKMFNVHRRLSAEAAAHAALRDRHIAGEWFRGTSHDITRIVEDAVKDYRIEAQQ